MAIHGNNEGERDGDGDSMIGPQTHLGKTLHKTKYRGKSESFKDRMNAIASVLTEGNEEFYAFRDMLAEQRFLPAGRVQAAIGSTKNVTAFNCFVSGVIEDSFVDGKNSIMNMATESAATMRMGGGIGYDFSTLRPMGEMIKKLQSSSSGPVSFMEIFDAVCKCIASSGHRRGAQMGVMRVDHPDIEEFIDAKREKGRLEGFNVSVGITDEFMQCLISDTPFTLRFGGEDYRDVNAGVLWDKIMRSNYDWAEPGVLFLDRINNCNNLWYCETITATNPCGEQPLPPYGACLLGSMNLVKYLLKYAECEHHSFDYSRFRDDVALAVRCMDRVIDNTTYPLAEQEAEAKSKRRMGIGVTGVANAIEAMGFPYGSKLFCEHLESILLVLKETAYQTSALLADERGSFPLYDQERYLAGQFIRKLSKETRDMIEKHGIRNSHLISIAPTGTISMCADNVSSGIEPVFANKALRRIGMPGGYQIFEADDYGLAQLGVQAKLMPEVTVEEHIRVLTTGIRHVDSAISKTCNFPKDVDYEEFKKTYYSAWVQGAKGLTIYRHGCKREGIIEAVEEKPNVCKIDPETGQRDCGD